MKTLIPFVAVAAIASSAPAALVAAWDFQTTSNGGTAVAAAPNAPSVLNANFGSGTLYLNGTNGASTWVTASAGNEVTAFGGSSTMGDTTIGLSTTTSGLGSLALVGGAASGSPATYAANGKSVMFVLNLTGLQNLSLSFSSQRSGTGFTAQNWQTSTDGATWTSWGSFSAGTSAGTIAGSFATSGVLSLTGTSALDNAAVAYVRVTFTGASSTSGNNRLDNVIFNADAIPSQGAVALLGLAGFVARRRR